MTVAVRRRQAAPVEHARPAEPIPAPSPASPPPEAAPAYVPSPWFRLFASEWLASTRGLKPAEAGILISLLAMMHEHGSPLREDHDRLARRCSTTKAAFGKVIETLLSERQIIRKQGGGLWSDFIEQEIAFRAEKSQKLRKNSSKRWEKTKQNQASDDANGYRVQRLEGSSSTTKNPTSLDTTGARAHSARLQVQQRITIDDFELLEVERLLPNGRVVFQSVDGGGMASNANGVLVPVYSGDFVVISFDRNGSALTDTAQVTELDN